MTHRASNRLSTAIRYCSTPSHQPLQKERKAIHIESTQVMIESTQVMIGRRSRRIQSKSVQSEKSLFDSRIRLYKDWPKAISYTVGFVS